MSDKQTLDEALHAFKLAVIDTVCDGWLALLRVYLVAVAIAVIVDGYR